MWIPTSLGKSQVSKQRQLSLPEFVILEYLQHKSVSPCLSNEVHVFVAFKSYKKCPHENMRIEKCYQYNETNAMHFYSIY
jgi:hypothetical protein